jgi:hypothetical protein
VSNIDSERICAGGPSKLGMVLFCERKRVFLIAIVEGVVVAMKFPYRE